MCLHIDGAMCNSLRMPDQLLTAAEVCRFLQIDRSTLIRWVDAGKVKAAQKLPGQTGAYLFDPAEIARLLLDRGLDRAPRAG